MEKESYEKIKTAVSFIKKQTDISPKIGLILGSGLGGVADSLTDRVELSYDKIPFFLPSSVEGHQGKMVLGKLSGIPSVILQGRLHFYEGHAMEDVAFPTRVLGTLGIRSLILTNAAGGINTRFRPGDLMLIEDQLNLMGINPLRGPNLGQLGPRFPDMSEPYHLGQLRILKEASTKVGIPFHSGVYAAVGGPSYETPAEIRMLRVLGADAVGMSTAPECVAANHMGVSVSGISCITNLAAGLSSQKLSHDEVIEIGRTGAERMIKLLLAAVPEMARAER